MNEIVVHTEKFVINRQKDFYNTKKDSAPGELYASFEKRLMLQNILWY
jgi:hypothetical protein